MLFAYKNMRCEMLKLFALIPCLLALVSTSFGSDISSEERETNAQRATHLSAEGTKPSSEQEVDKSIPIRQKSRASTNAIPMHEHPQQNKSLITKILNIFC